MITLTISCMISCCILYIYIYIHTHAYDMQETTSTWAQTTLPSQTPTTLREMRRTVTVYYSIS